MRTRMAWLGCIVYVGLVWASPEGVWSTIDEKTGEKRADVRFELVQGELVGTIVHPYSKPGDVTHCGACSGTFKNQPVAGLRFIWGLKPDGTGAWVGGKILDPESGRVYRFKLVEKGRTLEVRGYLGHPMLGRTQVWVKAEGVEQAG